MRAVTTCAEHARTTSYARASALLAWSLTSLDARLRPDLFAALRVAMAERRNVAPLLVEIWAAVPSSQQVGHTDAMQLAG